jgi:hypothetical protein
MWLSTFGMCCFLYVHETCLTSGCATFLRLLEDSKSGETEKDREAYDLAAGICREQFRGSIRRAATRAERALEKLRKYFSKRGVNSTTATLAVAISANSVQAAPVTLAKSVTAVAIAKGATALLPFAAKIILHFVVIAREIKRQHTLVRLKNKPPCQPGAAFVKMFPQLPNRQPGNGRADCQSRPGQVLVSQTLLLPAALPARSF